MSQHTPGIWEAIPPAKVGKHWMVGTIGVVDGKRALWVVARIDNGRPGDTLDTEEANARLIAAAPDLLAACKLCQQILEHPQMENFEGLPYRALTAVREAIRKAKGGA